MQETVKGLSMVATAEVLINPEIISVLKIVVQASFEYFFCAEGFVHVHTYMLFVKNINPS